MFGSSAVRPPPEASLAKGGFPKTTEPPNGRTAERFLWTARAGAMVGRPVGYPTGPYGARRLIGKADKPGEKGRWQCPSERSTRSLVPPLRSITPTGSTSPGTSRTAPSSHRGSPGRTPNWSAAYSAARAASSESCTPDDEGARRASTRQPQTGHRNGRPFQKDVPRDPGGPDPEVEGGPRGASRAGERAPRMGLPGGGSPYRLLTALASRRSASPPYPSPRSNGSSHTPFPSVTAVTAPWRSVR